MAAGATIAGSVRFVRVMVNGTREVVAGPFSSGEMDHKADPAYSVHFNEPANRVPSGTNLKMAKDAEWDAGEILAVEHLAAALAEAADYDLDEISIGILKEDKNRNKIIPSTLTVADTTLAADPTTSTTVWTTFFSYTVPDRVKIALHGICNVACCETA